MRFKTFGLVHSVAQLKGECQQPSEQSHNVDSDLLLRASEQMSLGSNTGDSVSGRLDFTLIVTVFVK